MAVLTDIRGIETLTRTEMGEEKQFSEGKKKLNETEPTKNKKKNKKFLFALKAYH